GPPPPTARPAAAHLAGSRSPGWLVASATAIAPTALVGTALRLHHRKPATVPDSQLRPAGRLPVQPSRSQATGVTLHGGCPRRVECPYRPNGRFPAQARSAGCHA